MKSSKRSISILGDKFSVFQRGKILKSVIDNFIYIFRVYASKMKSHVGRIVRSNRIKYAFNNDYVLYFSLLVFNFWLISKSFLFFLFFVFTFMHVMCIFSKDEKSYNEMARLDRVCGIVSRCPSTKILNATYRYNFKSIFRNFNTI